MAMNDLILKGLFTSPKYIPKWYQWDKEGSRLFDKNTNENKFYYMHKSETGLLENNIHEITHSLKKVHQTFHDNTDLIGTIKMPCDYIDLGCGTMKKSRIIIDTLLSKQSKLDFYPVDISADMLQNACEDIGNEYGDKLKILPIPGDYSDGINAISNNTNRKLITFLGGGLQNVVYESQIELLSNIQSAMTDDDILAVTLDITEDESDVHKAYLGDEGQSGLVETFRNVFSRLNRDYGTSIDPYTFTFEGTFTKSNDRDELSRWQNFAKSSIDQVHYLGNGKAEVRFFKEEIIRLNDCDASSYKYSLKQVKRMCEKSQLTITKILIAKDKHTACFVLKKASAILTN